MVNHLHSDYQSKKLKKLTYKIPRMLIKSKLHSNTHKPKIKQEINNTQSTLTPNLQSFKERFLSGSGFVENK